MKRIIKIAYLLVLPLAIILFIYTAIYLRTPSHVEGFKKTITIRRGMTFKEVAQLLGDEGIIRGIKQFILLGKFSGASPKVKAGEYELSSDMTPLQILDALTKGKVKQYKVSIPEGYTVSQIAEILESKEITNSEVFLERCFSSQYVSSLGIEADGLEGYLFPDSYLFSKALKPEDIIEAMVRRFRRVYTTQYSERGKELGFSDHEILTLASMIEKEAAIPWERFLVSGVYHNRLKRNMLLYSCPTVIYGIKDFDGNLTKRDLERYTPYNTYRIRGLPPGPICNPGKEAIVAALYPAKTEYLYFVSKNDGSHHFSSTLEEHNIAVWRYQKGRNYLIK
ncbi:MAG: endolytic transglycosylase MltG [Syntrophobacterales bacterium]|nr:MAG: endolytic transglycosylase MltG [Syntrophobacterales bacterium]